MTSLYFILHGARESRLRAVSAQMSRDGDTAIMRCHDSRGFVWVGDGPENYGPVRDDATGVELVTSGRLVWPQKDWALAQQLPFKGGVANRLMLARYLKNGPGSVTPYNGAATILISDPRDRSVHLWTDQFGYHPSFVYRQDDPRNCIITTFPDALLGDPDAPVTQDRVSMADFIRAWRVTPPHTYYREVKHAGAATYRYWSGQGSNIPQQYWNAVDGEFFENISVAAQQLADAITISIRERTAAAQRPVFFVSGGADSRVLLFASSDPSKAVGINLYERPMLEASTARRLCEIAGVRYVGVQRDNDFYPRMLHEDVRWSGAMWSIEDSHYLGVREYVDRENPDLVMSACTTDWIFKGYGLEKTFRQFMGRDLPFYRYSDRRVDGFLPNVPLQAPPEYQREVGERMHDWFAGCPIQLNSERDRLIAEDRRARPACYAVSVSGQMMYRIFPYDTFLADSRVAECYRRIPPRWKLNSEVWGLAATKVCAGAADVVNANFGWRLDAGPLRRLSSFSESWVRRRLERLSALQSVPDDGHPPSTGSWPDMGWYAVHSQTLENIWYSVSDDDRQLMKSICGVDPWKRPLAEWAHDSSLLFRILTLIAHWDVSRERRARTHAAG
jgi:asparagine synthase (glutamine-hydrolysing)